MSIEATYTGYIETTQDTLLIFEACRRGLLPRICRRLQEKERKIVSSGSVFVFDERESGIKRWTDGLVWSPSRILGNFLVYRELDKRSSSGKKDTLSVERQRSNGNDMESQAEKNKERALVGSLTNSYRFKKDGLIKKTMSITVNGVAQHMISYYTKEDVLRGSLKTPSQTPQLATLEISQEFLLRQNFRIPPVIEGYGEGAEPTSPNSVISHSSISTSSSPVMSMTNGCTCSHHPTINNAGSVSPQQQQPSRMIDYNTSNRIKMEMENSESVYRPPNFTSSYTATPSSGFTSSYTYPPVNNTIADITNPTLPLPSTTNVRGFVAPHSHRQSFSNEFPPVTTASAHMTNPSSRILTSSPPLMPGHHLSNPATVTAAASDYSQYYSPHVSNTTSPTTTATASTWNDYQGFSYSSSTHSNSNGSSNQPLQSHQSHHGGHNESSNDVFYASTTGNPNSDTTTMYGGGAGNSYNDLPPSTLPELYNSSSSQSHHHHNQTGGPHSSSSPSPTMPPSPPILNHHHHHHHSSSNGSTSSSGSSSSNITPITPPLSSATTNDPTIISGTPISSVFASPTTTLNYSSQFTAATAAYVKGETGYATASPHSAAAAASLAGPNSGMYADAYLPWMA